MQTERENWLACPDCGGEGSTEEARPFHDDPYFSVSIKCKRCGGSGWECSEVSIVASFCGETDCTYQDGWCKCGMEGLSVSSHQQNPAAQEK